MLTFIAALALSPTAASEAAAAKDDPIICTRREHHEVGTRLPKKVCMKKSEWENSEKESGRVMNKLRERFRSPGAAMGRTESE